MYEALTTNFVKTERRLLLTSCHYSTFNRTVVRKNMKKHFVLALVFFQSFFIVEVWSQSETRLLRFPAIYGNQIVFSYAGDLYTVSSKGGTARKLTNDAGYEMFARFSPDGKQIAFTAQYDGNTEVYLMPSEGGIPKRLTYTATLDRDEVSDRMGPNNIVMGWKGGEPDRLPIAQGSVERFQGRPASGVGGRRPERAVAVAARRILFLFAGSQKAGLQPRLPRIPDLEALSWRAGGRCLDLRFRQQADNQHHQQSGPGYISRCGRATRSISYPTGTKTSASISMDMTLQTNRPENSRASRTSISSFHRWATMPSFLKTADIIYRFDLKSQKAEKVPIYIADDQVIGRGGWIDVSRQIANYEISPDGSRALFGAHGEIFTVPAKYGNTRNLTNTSGVHERSSKWSPDGKWIAYISDASGEDEIYIIPQDGSGPAKQLTKGADTYKFSLLWSPDSQKTALVGQEASAAVCRRGFRERDAGRPGKSLGDYGLHLVSRTASGSPTRSRKS